MAQQDRIGKTATTTARDNAGITRVTYHNTIVVSFGNGRVTLDSGGWRTATTKTRMNQAARQFGLGFTVVQVKGDWYVNTQDGQCLNFQDGMQFNYR